MFLLVTWLSGCIVKNLVFEIIVTAIPDSTPMIDIISEFSQCSCKKAWIVTVIGICKIGLGKLSLLGYVFTF